MAVSSDTRIGEVIETSTSGFWAESDQLHVHPPLGSLVQAPLRDGSTFYGIVAFGQTGGLDPSRRAIRRGDEELTDHAIYDRHPELEYILRTLFQVASAGYSAGSSIRHTLPPVPVPLHFSVNQCAPDTVKRFVRRPAYFPALLRYQGAIASEDLIAAHLNWVDQTLDDGHLWLASATRQLAQLMKRDYDRLKIILDGVDPG